MKKFSVATIISAVFLISFTYVNAATIEVLSVTNVSTADHLNVRAEPGTKSRVITTLPHNGKGIIATGEVNVIGQSTWVKISWGGFQGWVNKRFLEGNVLTVKNEMPTKPQASYNPISLECGGTEPFWSIDIARTRMKVNIMDAASYNIPIVLRSQSLNNPTIAVVGAKQGNRKLDAFLQKTNLCSDGMSDTNYPYSITALFNTGKVYSGCCNVAQ